MRPAVLALAATGCGLVTGIEVTAPPTVTAAAPAAPFALAAQDGRTVALAELLAAGDVVLVFYRGHW